MYSCKICSYNTLERTAIYHHNKTKKHIKNMGINEKQIKEETIKDDQIKILKEKEISNEKEIKELTYKIKDIESERDALLKYVDLLVKSRETIIKSKKYKT